MTGRQGEPSGGADSPAPSDSPSRWASAVLLVLVLVPTIFNAIALWPELSLPIPSLNDDAFHYLLVQRASEALASGENPFDHWSPELDLGFPQLFYYQHLPHLTVVFLHRLLLKQVDLLTLFNLIRYLLLVGFPLTVYWAMRRMEFSVVAAAVAAAAASLFSSSSRYGFEYESYIWRGWGLTTQLWAMHLSFITLACLDRLLRRGTGYVGAAVASSMLALSHLMYSYMMAPAGLVLLLVGLNRTNARQRVARLGITAALAAVITSYFWLPFVLFKAYLSASPYEPRWKYDSSGAGTVLTWLVNGDLLDSGRLPVLTLLLALGVVCAVFARTRPARLALILLVVWLTLFFGRPTWGRLLDLLPMHERLHFHRFIGGAHLAAILLIGLGGEWIWRQLAPLQRWRSAAGGLLLMLLLLPAIQERQAHYAVNSQWMERTWTALQADQDAPAILSAIAARPPGRTSAGRRNNWGKSLRLGDLYFFDLLTFNRIVAISPYESFSLNADLIWHFEDQNPAHYNLFNVRYVVAPSDLAMPAFLRRIKETSQYILYEAETSGYAQFVAVNRIDRIGSQSTLFSRNRSWMEGADPAAGRFVRYDYPAGSAGSGSVAEGAASGAPDRARCLGSGKINEERVLPGRFDLWVECPEASTLVLKVTYHPNWRIAIDGREVRSFMVSPSFIGLDVPAGAHQIRAEYRSPVYKTALLLLGACVLLGTVLLRRRFAQLEAILAPSAQDGARNDLAPSPHRVPKAELNTVAGGEGLSAANRRGRLWLGVAAVACGIASLFYGLQFMVTDDDVEHLHSIWLIAHGVLPYREFFEVHPPGLYLLLSPLARFVETPSLYFLAARSSVALLFGLTIWLAGRAVGARGVQILVLVEVALFTLIRCEVYMFRAEYVTTFLLIAHLALLIGGGERPGTARSVLAGLLLALAGTMSVRMLPFLAVQPLATLWLARRSAGRPLRAWGAGLLLGVLPSCVYLTTHHLWGDMVFWAFRFVSMPGIVTWGVRLTHEDWLLIAVGSAAAGVVLTAATLPRATRVVLPIAWVLALAFHIFNPVRVAYSAINALLTTGMLLTAIPLPFSNRSGGFSRAASAATLVVGLVCFLPLDPPPKLRFERETQRAQLHLLDWLREAAGTEPVVLVGPHHPMTVLDATHLKSAWQYSFWIGNAYVAAGLRPFGRALLRQPPPVIAANPWPWHTRGKDLIGWLSDWNILSKDEARQLQLLFSQRYVKVAFPSLAAVGGVVGDEFWVRQDRFDTVPPPKPYRTR